MQAFLITLLHNLLRSPGGALSSPPAAADPPVLEPAVPHRSSLPRTSLLRRTLTPPAIVLAAALFLAEDIVWGITSRCLAAISRHPFAAWIEARVQALGPYPTLLLFLIPALALFPVKLLGMWLAASGHPLFGLAVFAGAKIGGTAIAARIFTLSREKLLGISWFRSGHDWLLALKHRLYAAVRSLPAWPLASRKVRALAERVRALVPAGRGALSRRTAAARRRLFRRPA
mgnify:CR=1 FL=1